MQTAVDALSDSETMAFLQLPKVSVDRKLQLLRDVLKDLSPTVLNLLGLLTSKGGLPRCPVYSVNINGCWMRARAESALRLRLPLIWMKGRRRSLAIC